MKIRIRRRNLIQVFCLALFIFLARQTHYPLHLKGWSNLFFRLDPFLGITAGLAAGKFILAFWPALLLLALTFFWGRFFCRNICPLGTCIDLASFLSARKHWRKSPRLKFLFAVQVSLLLIFLALAVFGLSGLAQEFDPLTISLGALLYLPASVLFLVIVSVSTVFPRFWCFNLCPLGAILELEKRVREKLKRRPVAFDLSRRQFVEVSALGLLAAGGLKFAVRKTKVGERILRPPAANKEPAFTSLCVRCGECVKVCPSNGLKPTFLETGLEGLGTPRLVPRIGPCELCFLCYQVCPSSAIKKTQLGQFKIGTSQIDHKRCIAWGQGKLCLVCMEYCPVSAIHPDDRKRPVVDEKVCIGCGACEKQCPVAGEAAIIVLNQGEIRG
jgi:ferredoxin-type protein NapF